MTKAPTTTRTQGGRFAPGNPGRPKGARHKVTVAVEKLLDADAKAITKKAIELAKAGDTTALRLCLERIAPPRKGRVVTVSDMPKVESPADVPNAIATLLHAVAAGELSTEEANDVAGIFDRYVRAVETVDLDQRLKALEQKLGGK